AGRMHGPRPNRLRPFAATAEAELYDYRAVFVVQLNRCFLIRVIADVEVMRPALARAPVDRTSLRKEKRRKAQRLGAVKVNVGQAVHAHNHADVQAVTIEITVGVGVCDAQLLPILPHRVLADRDGYRSVSPPDYVKGDSENRVLFLHVAALRFRVAASVCLNSRCRCSGVSSCTDAVSE